MPEYVRVKDKGTGHEYTLTADRFEAHKDGLTELDKAAVDSAGVPLPPKYKTTVSAEAEKKASQKAATSKKENR